MIARDVLQTNKRHFFNRYYLRFVVPYEKLFCFFGFRSEIIAIAETKHFLTFAQKKCEKKNWKKSRMNLLWLGLPSKKSATP